MADEEIKQHAHDYTYTNDHNWTWDDSGESRVDISAEISDAFIAGAHSRDEEMKKLEESKRKLRLRLMQQIHELRNPWISVDERLPEDGKDVFVRKICTNGIFHLVGKTLNNGKWYCYGFGWQDNGVITHWMPIPAIQTIQTQNKED